MGSVFNIAGGTSCTMLDLIGSVASAVGAAPCVIKEADAVGDVKRTGGSTDRALEQLGWRPEVGLDEGVSRQADWMRQKGDAT
jgi:nucleoside-diphosphate-sugar epimerase